MGAESCDSDNLLEVFIWTGLDISVSILDIDYNAAAGVYLEEPGGGGWQFPILIIPEWE